MTKGRLELLVILILPIFVIGLSLIVFFWGRDWVAPGTASKGVLLAPPIQLAELGFESNSSREIQGHWAVILVPDADCDIDCMQMAEKIERMPILLNRNADRMVAVVNVATTDIHSLDLEKRFAPEYWLYLFADKSLLAGRLVELGIDKDQLKNFILLADPRGNIILFYTKGQTGLILLDLKKLLKFSQIG